MCLQGTVALERQCRSLVTADMTAIRSHCTAINVRHAFTRLSPHPILPSPLIKKVHLRHAHKHEERRSTLETEKLQYAFVIKHCGNLRWVGKERTVSVVTS